MSDTSQGDGWWQASDGKFYPPAAQPDRPPPPPPPAGDPQATPTEETEFTLKVREDGKNGLVTVGPKGITRVIARRLGKDDRQFIPFGKIHMVEHNRKTLGTDVVTVHVGSGTLEWKVAANAERFVDLVNERIS